MLCILYAVTRNEMIFIEDDQTDVFSGIVSLSN